MIDSCDYRYPGNHRRCGRPAALHVKRVRPGYRVRPFNFTADNHDFVPLRQKKEGS